MAEAPNSPFLADVLERQFLPNVCSSTSDAYRTRFRVAVRWFSHTLGRAARTSDLSIDAMDLLAATLINANFSRNRMLTLRRSLMTLWKFAARLGIAPEFVDLRLLPAAPLTIFGGRRSSPLRGWRKGQRIDLAPPAPGTLRAYFEECYRPQMLALAEQSTLLLYKTTFLTFWRWLGRDATLGDCSDERVAEYFNWARSAGMSGTTINRHVCNWHALWRHAQRAGLIDAGPHTAKLPEERPAVDAWSMEELAALVSATATFRPGRQLRGVPYPLLLRTILIVGYHIAVRRRSLLSIATCDVELSSGTVTIRPRNMKNRRGRRYKLPPYAVDEVREIFDPRRELLFPITPQAATNCFKRLVRHAGLPRSTHPLGSFHKLRRTAATQAAILGGLREASELMGHSDAYVTRRYIDETKLPASATSARLPSIQLDGGD